MAQDFATFLKKKGFIYPSSEIYGGLSGFYDYGHLGTLLKHNFENEWRKFFLSLGENFFEIETANIMHEKVFKASGHIDNFIDPIVKCSKCDFSERADHLLEVETKQRAEGLSPEELTKQIKKHNLVCPHCKSPFQDVSVMNMMFPVNLGIGSSTKGYLRPETAQSPYVNFKLQFELLRKRLPMGLALIGRAYRNEISPRNLTLRMREFTQAELQIFFNPNAIKDHPDFDSIKNYKLLTLLEKDRKKKKPVERTAQDLVKEGFPKFYVYHLARIQQFYLDVLDVPKGKFRFYQLDNNEKAFYNKYHFDIEVELNSHGFTEVGGLHYRTDHDLSGHQKISKQKMEVFDEASQQKVTPHVLELSFGVDRNVFALLDLNYKEDKDRGNVVLAIPHKFTPFYCAVFPLVKNKDEVVAKAKRVYAELKGVYSCYYDTTGTVGRRYARADEQGVKYCITVDFEDDGCVTVRDRDTTKQERVKIEELKDYLYGLWISSKN